MTDSKLRVHAALSIIWLMSRTLLPVHSSNLETLEVGRPKKTKRGVKRRKTRQPAEGFCFGWNKQLPSLCQPGDGGDVHTAGQLIRILMLTINL